MAASDIPKRNAGGCHLGLFNFGYQVRISFCPRKDTRKPATTGTMIEIACKSGGRGDKIFTKGGYESRRRILMC